MLRVEPPTRQPTGLRPPSGIFVVFGDEVFGRNTHPIAYVWAGTKPVGSEFVSPYIDAVATIVLA